MEEGEFSEAREDLAALETPGQKLCCRIFPTLFRFWLGVSVHGHDFWFRVILVLEQLLVRRQGHLAKRTILILLVGHTKLFFVLPFFNKGRENNQERLRRGRYRNC